jgi:trehalose 6-phosphate phosphatase
MDRPCAECIGGGASILDVGDDDGLAGVVRSPHSSAILLDVDGTLSPIVASPDLAALADGAKAELVRLVGRYRVVAAISGRTNDELARLVDVPGLVRIGMYGLEAVNLPADIVSAVRAAAETVPGTWVEPKGATIAVHYREAPDPDAAWRALGSRLRAVADRAGLEIAAGKRVAELVPAGQPLKAQAVDRVLADPQIRAALYAGDDVADLQAFAALDRAMADGRLERAVKVAVRASETPPELLDGADVVVDAPDGVVRLLRRL